MNILILGANGYLGSNFSLFINDRNLEIYHGDIHEKPIYEWMNYHRIDLLDFDFEKFICTNKIDYIYVFSGLTGTLNSFEIADKFIDVNIKGVAKLLQDLLKLKSKPTVIFPSTRLVYHSSNLLLKEDDEKQLNTPYAVSKLAAENLIQAYGKFHSINYYIFRLSIPFGNIGTSDYSFGTVGSFIKQLQEKNKIILYGDGSQKRTFTSVIDICTILSQCLDHRLNTNEIYNIGGEALSLRQAAEIISKDPDKLYFKEWPQDYLKIESWDTVFCSKKLDDQIDINYLKLSDIQNF